METLHNFLNVKVYSPLGEDNGVVCRKAQLFDCDDYPPKFSLMHLCLIGK